jgi:hypothetical protein
MAKTKLIDAISNTNRGLTTTLAEREAIMTAIAELETANSHPRPLTESLDLLAGNWRLIYTSSQSLLGIDRIPLLSLGNIYQYLQPSTGTLYNIAEVNSLLPGLDGIVVVVASFTPVNERRVNVRFNRSIIGLQNLIKYQSPTTFIEAITSVRPLGRAKGERKFTAIDLPINSSDRGAWLEITYLDETLRIGRGNEGNVFVLVRE